MHEMSIATGLLDKLLEFAQSNPDKHLIKVSLEVGELALLHAEQLRFCFEAITNDTPLAGCDLEIQTILVTVQCPHCAYCGRPKYWEDALASTAVVTLRCPECGKAAEAIEGHECAIRSVRYRKEVLT